MDIPNARKQLKTRMIYTLALRVAFYARVSSESENSVTPWGTQSPTIMKTAGLIPRLNSTLIPPPCRARFSRY